MNAIAAQTSQPLLAQNRPRRQVGQRTVLEVGDYLFDDDLLPRTLGRLLLDWLDRIVAADYAPGAVVAVAHMNQQV